MNPKESLMTAFSDVHDQQRGNEIRAAQFQQRLQRMENKMDVLETKLDNILKAVTWFARLATQIWFFDTTHSCWLILSVKTYAQISFNCTRGIVFSIKNRFLFDRWPSPLSSFLSVIAWQPRFASISLSYRFCLFQIENICLRRCRARSCTGCSVTGWLYLDCWMLIPFRTAQKKDNWGEYFCIILIAWLFFTFHDVSYASNLPIKLNRESF